jgi:hypothetical protein
MIPSTERRRWYLRGRRSGTATWRSFRVGMPAATVISMGMPPRAHPALIWDRVTPARLLPWGLPSPWDAFGALRCYHGGALPKPDIVTLLRSSHLTISVHLDRCQSYVQCCAAAPHMAADGRLRHAY